MRKLVCVFLLAFLPFAAHGQITGQNFVHDFGSHKVYLRINTMHNNDVSWIETARIEDHVCKEFYVQEIEISKDTLKLGKSTKWAMQRTRNGILFTFPSGKSVKYKATRRDGTSICLRQGKDI
jgi:hypothetical protein